jgi:hypothetical protein
MNLRSLANKAKQMVDRRGGSSALKQDAQELRDIARGPGTVGDKAKAAAQALREPGATRSEPPARAQRPTDHPREPPDSTPGVQPPGAR